MANKYSKSIKRTNVHTSWEPIAEWYHGWMGVKGSKHHRHLAIPTVMEMLDLQSGYQILDLGAGQGVLAPFITQTGANYTGVEASQRLIHLARRHHGQQGRFILGDVRKLPTLSGLQPAFFDRVIFLLSIQDMDPLSQVLQSASWALKQNGYLVILMTHPCFRPPRQSGWGWDQKRKLQYRRIDRYLTPLSVPMKTYLGERKGTTVSFHRPLSIYINDLAACGLMVDKMREVPTYKVYRADEQAKAKNLAQQEIPLFLGLRAKKSV